MAELGVKLLIPVGLAIAGAAGFFLLRDGPDAANAGPVVESRMALDFPGATGWKAEAACTDVVAADFCAGEWTHEQGQKVRVLLVPLPDPGKLASMTERLKADVESKGGVVQEVEQGGTRVVRLLQPAVRAEDNAAVVNISYLMASPDQRLLHIVTSLAPQPQQEAADGRVRDLLAFAVWTQ